ncbi:CDP-diacylglycerol diphosphatase [Chimaeribacter arupi]|uniref:CDP-diacylglycerol pyrophosphatase n=1 Tax=Nissabacter archeti TaxID=1917880 RepID=A0ABS5JDE8_9GAMM|nr:MULTISPECIES: CDP-diacylglycerol diphosphatase [Yersiniaceae]MBS0967982.1 CDP-diacylglycerol diphosphatase [Nissabacter archeti]MDV5140600.1 CDP-diacylglycerol diphosphatase [Chimaeribacter arupi]PLR50437.1 CDP-diacylglycerol diphosphatase [Chimaeribacter arupi]PLR54530.1 CDP-diacylglycerol diphosphatase [Chimaeribacter arupi]
MPRIRGYRVWSVLCIALCLLAAGAYLWLRPAHPDALWKIVSEQCLPNLQRTGQASPCALANPAAGYVVLKDQNGPLQYLLMPAAKTTGIESPELLAAKTPNFFMQAWQARGVMARRYGRPIDDSVISLAINSEWGRTQNQLHIHLSCLRPAVQQQLQAADRRITPRWQPLTLDGRPWLARRVTPEEFAHEGAFRLLAEGVPGAKEKMGHYGLAMVRAKSGDFLLLAIERDLLSLNLASAETLQDHECRLLENAGVPPGR